MALPKWAKWVIGLTSPLLITLALLFSIATISGVFLLIFNPWTGPIITGVILGCTIGAGILTLISAIPIALYIAVPLLMTIKSGKKEEDVTTEEIDVDISIDSVGFNVVEKTSESEAEDTKKIVQGLNGEQKNEEKNIEKVEVKKDVKDKEDFDDYDFSFATVNKEKEKYDHSSYVSVKSDDFIQVEQIKKVIQEIEALQNDIKGFKNKRDGALEAKKHVDKLGKEDDMKKISDIVSPKVKLYEEKIKQKNEEKAKKVEELNSALQSYTKENENFSEWYRKEGGKDKLESLKEDGICVPKGLEGKTSQFRM